ncbi:hypothetical protein [Marinicellulosiphila megalodicopiae]|uniref:hypothetical protein n=1 Tax=Marinicellulosiphila megalodicopiae TaxID=2724896 RepID=UPI003BB0EBCE
MRNTASLVCLSLITLSCQTTGANHSSNDDLIQAKPIQTPSTSVEPVTEVAFLENDCPGDTELPAHLMGQFEPIDDQELLQSVLGKPNKGALCQGKVYQSVSPSSITVYRAWNSTNTHSEMGTWWAGEIPAGLTAQYRTDYEICYQWSPLDKMTQCTLKAGAKVVIGTGQSAMCSEYLTYPASPEKQIYIQNASDVLEDCEQYDAVFDWQSQ